MDRTVTIPEEVYEQLEQAARSRHLGSVEQLLQEVANQEQADRRRRRDEAVRRIDELRERILAEHGELPDVVELIREDRER
jgi:predicted CopG family antitoxin